MHQLIATTLSAPILLRLDCSCWRDPAPSRTPSCPTLDLKQCLGGTASFWTGEFAPFPPPSQFLGGKGFRPHRDTWSRGLHALEGGLTLCPDEAVMILVSPQPACRGTVLRPCGFDAKPVVEFMLSTCTNVCSLHCSLNDTPPNGFGPMPFAFSCGPGLRIAGAAVSRGWRCIPCSRLTMLTCLPPVACCALRANCWPLNAWHVQRSVMSRLLEGALQAGS